MTTLSSENDISLAPSPRLRRRPAPLLPAFLVLACLLRPAASAGLRGASLAIGGAGGAGAGAAAGLPLGLGAGAVASALWSALPWAAPPHGGADGELERLRTAARLRLLAGEGHAVLAAAQAHDSWNASGEVARAIAAAADLRGAAALEAGAEERLRRVSRLADSDGDGRLSAEEMRSFAERLKEYERREHTARAMRRVDADGSGSMSLWELRGATQHQRGAESGHASQHQERRFRAADRDGDGALDLAELHAFAHPEVDAGVFAVELDYQLSLFDSNGDGRIDFQEFRREAQTVSEDDFDEAATWEDFRLHDADGDGWLDRAELGYLLSGHMLLEDSVRKVVEAGDGDGDGHLHLEHELPARLHHLLDSEFVEDFFLHADAERAHLHAGPGSDEL